MILYTMHLFVQLRKNSSRSLRISGPTNTVHICNIKTKLLVCVQNKQQECLGLSKLRIAQNAMAFSSSVYPSVLWFMSGESMSQQSLPGGPDLIWAMSCLISGTSQRCQNATKVVCILRCWEEFDQWVYELFVILASSNMLKVEISALQASLMSHSSKL